MRILGIVIPLLVVSGCDEWQTALFGPRIGTTTTDTAAAVPLDCADVDGTFYADTLDFTSEDDSRIYEDFGDYPDFTVVFDAYDETFESMLVIDDRVYVSSGSYSVIGDRLVFDAPLMEGMGPSAAALGCDYDGVSLTLYGPTRYDFSDDDVDGPVDADFMGVFDAE